MVADWRTGELKGPALTYLEEMVVHVEFTTALAQMMGGVNTYRFQQARCMTIGLFQPSISSYTNHCRGMVWG